MKLLQLTIQAQGALVFPSQKPGQQYRKSLEYVPGATIYGALGQRLRALDAADPARFKALFRQIRCRNAYPAWPGDPWVRPIPRSAEKPKGYEGSPSDTLIARVCWEQLAPPGVIFSPTDPHGRSWEADGGFYAPADSRDTARSQIKRRLNQRLITHVSINRRRGTAEDQQLYALFALSEANSRHLYDWDEAHTPAHERIVASVKSDFPTLFLGSVVLPANAPPDLTDEIGRIEVLGARTTTGMGSVAIAVQEATPEDGAAIRTRIDRLNARFRQWADLYRHFGSQSGWQPSGDLFTVNLQSDAILYEHSWRPTMTLTGEMLRRAAGLSQIPTLLRAFAAYGYVGGWHVRWPGPKPSQVSTALGSVFVFHAPSGLSADDCDRLAALQLTGIGERRAEGYGQIRICDEFHIQHELRLEQQ